MFIATSQPLHTFHFFKEYRLRSFLKVVCGSIYLLDIYGSALTDSRKRPKVTKGIEKTVGLFARKDSRMDSTSSLSYSGGQNHIKQLLFRFPGWGARLGSFLLFIFVNSLYSWVAVPPHKTYKTCLICQWYFFNFPRLGSGPIDFKFVFNLFN